LNLEIKLLNSGKHTVFFHRAVAEVTYSRNQSKPLLVLDVSKPGQLRVTNVGTTTPDPLQLRVALAGPKDELSEARLPPPTTVPFSGGTAVIPLSGLDPSIEQTAYGELILGSRIRKFELAVGDVSKAAPSASSTPLKAGHLLTFRSPGEGYEIECPLSQYLQANEGDRIPLRLQAEETSLHRFRLRLEYDDGSGGPARVLRTRMIEAELFQPKEGL
jgi:hypothetical protein